MQKPVKPVIVVSRCLGFANCRWNGECINDHTIDSMRPWVEFQTLCPEMDIGLGVPRDPVRLVQGKDLMDIRLVQHNTGLDVTEKMRQYAASVSHTLNATGIILKSKSPSCGLRGVKIYKDMEKGSKVALGSGLFGEEILRTCQDIPIEDEGRLSNFVIREHFLTRIFVLERYRIMTQAETVRELQEFHADHKYLFMAYNQDQLHQMGKIAAMPLPAPELFPSYRMAMQKALAYPIRFTNAINVLLHIFGHFSDKLSDGEKAYFLDTVTLYRQAKVPLSLLQSLLRSWSIRFEDKYLAKQYFFEPYPKELMEITDSGKGRDT